MCKHHILISFYINLEIIGNIFNVFSSFNLHFLDIWLARVTGQQNRSSIIRQSNSKRKLGVLCHTQYIGTWFLISGWMKTDNVAIPAFSNAFFILYPISFLNLYRNTSLYSPKYSRMLTLSDFFHIFFVLFFSLFIYLNNKFFIMFIESKPEGRKTILGKYLLNQ